MKALFVFVKCELGKAYEVADRIVEQVEETSEVYSVSGQYDLLVKLYLDDEVDIGHFVCERLQKLDYIKDTFTLITFKVFTS